MAVGLTYDTGALIGAERDHRLVWALHRAALRRGIVPVVPAGVLAEAWRGGPQARLSIFLHGCRVEPLDEPVARRVGTLAGRSGVSDVVDMGVIEGAARRDDAVVTSDPTHLRDVAAATGRELAIHVV